MTKVKGGGNAIFSFELPSLDWRQEKKKRSIETRRNTKSATRMVGFGYNSMNHSLHQPATELGHMHA